MIASKEYVDQTLRKYNLKANKALGQNFLVEKDIALKITDEITASSAIEIGPGLGALTECLLNRNVHVHAFEIDANMASILSDTFKDNFELTNIDFLKVDIEKLLKENPKAQIISNLPYYITTKILTKILVNDLNIDCFIAMMQKEVAKKLINPELKDKSVLTTIIEYCYDVKVITHVSKNFYLPRPEIDSIVLKFTKKENKEANFASLLCVLQNLFNGRRKTISNNLKGIIDENKLLSVNIDPSLRVEQLTLKDFIVLSKLIEN